MRSLEGELHIIEAWLCHRRSMGIDISKLALQTTRAKIDEMKSLASTDDRISLSDEREPVVISGDALHVDKLIEKHGTTPGSVQLVCAHPPYLDSLRFTDKDERDLSLIKDPAVFYRKMSTFARHVYSTLKSHGVCALLIGDVRKEGRLIPLRFQQCYKVSSVQDSC